VEAFESALATFLGVRHVVAVSSGTAALHLALAGLDRDERDQVIVPSLTFAATVQAVLLAGYTPVFAEVNERDLNIDSKDVAGLISRRTRAILPVHLAGCPCDLAKLSRLAGDAGVALIEDAAHAFGSRFQGRPVGQHGAAVCFSFSANKNISCAEGGAVATNSTELAERIRRQRFLGITRHTWDRRNQEQPWHYLVTDRGFRYHMSDINAAIGLVQLQRFSEFARKRRQIAVSYDAGVRDLSRTVLLQRDWSSIVPNLYILRIKDGLRDTLHARLREAGIQCGVHYVPNHLQPAFRAHTRPMPVTESLADEVISLPLHPTLTETQVNFIIAQVRGVLEEATPTQARQVPSACLPA
jgi:perosamine synthetase